MSGMTWLAWGAIFTASFLLTYGISLTYSTRQQLKRRINETEVASPGVAIFRPEEATNPLKKWLSNWLISFGKLARKNQEETKVQSMLIHANFRKPNAITIFYGIKVLSAMLLPIPFSLLLIVRGNLTLLPLLGLFLVGAIGYALPQFFLNKIVHKRQDKIDRMLPDVIDLFVICMEAGLALQATINRVAEEIRGVCHDFYTELQITAGEMRTGISRDTALKNLGKRTGVQSLKSLVTLMVQSEKLGTSLADSLRAHADFSRVQRTLRAEEMAAKLPVKIVIPLVLFILPAMFIVIVGPGAIVMAKTLLPLLFGKH
jgi:tight adherence protein C